MIKTNHHCTMTCDSCQRVVYEGAMTEGNSGLAWPELLSAVKIQSRGEGTTRFDLCGDCMVGVVAQLRKALPPLEKGRPVGYNGKKGFRFQDGIGFNIRVDGSPDATAEHQPESD